MSAADVRARILGAFRQGQFAGESDDRHVRLYDPFEGDFGDGVRVLGDDLIVVRKPHACFHCDGPIAKGERVRRQTAVVDGEMQTARWCPACCAEMAFESAALALGEEIDEANEYSFERRSPRSAFAGQP